MNKVLKKALGFAGALGLTAVMVLAAAPVQASDVDARIQVLERELAQLKQNQQVADDERALAAEMKAPAITYTAGRGLTIAAADNAWSLNIGNRFQVYSSFWMTNDDDQRGTGNGVIYVRRHRPDINVTSGGGFYRLVTQLDIQDTGNARSIDGDMYLNFGMTNPWLPNLGYGANPSFSGSRALGASRPEDSLLQNALSLAGAQDRSIVLAWSGLPAMGTAQLTHLNVAMGHDQGGNGYSAPPVNSDTRSLAFGIGISPFAKIEAMGGLNVSNINYSFGYEKLPDPYTDGLTITTQYLPTNMTLATAGSVTGVHDYQAHGVNWRPVGFLGLSANYINYEGKSDAATTKANEFKIAANLSVWSPEGGLMGAGGLTVAPMYSSANLDWTGGDGGSAEVTNYGLAFGYPIPGGGFTITGVWDNFRCEGTCADYSAAAGDEESFNVFTFIIEYNF